MKTDLDRFNLVEVRWVDIEGDPTWKDDEQVEEARASALATEAVTVGFLYAADDKAVVVVGTVRPSGSKHEKSSYSDMNTIPTGCVRSIRVLRKARISSTPRTPTSAPGTRSKE